MHHWTVHPYITNQIMVIRHGDKDSPARENYSRIFEGGHLTMIKIILYLRRVSPCKKLEKVTNTRETYYRLTNN